METHSPDKIGDIAKKFAIRIVGEKLEVNEFGEKIYSFNPHLNDFMHCDREGLFAALRVELNADVAYRGPTNSILIRLRKTGPGTLEHRYTALLRELDKRFPGVVNPFHSDPAEPKYLAAIDSLIEEADNCGS